MIFKHFMADIDAARRRTEMANRRVAWKEKAKNKKLLIPILKIPSFTVFPKKSK
jgi:hypothetical protein